MQTQFNFSGRKTNPMTKNNLPDYRKKSDEELRYIISDAGEAARAMKGHSPAAELKYLDQINDASTVLYERAAKFRERKTNPTTKDAFLYIVHVCDANKKPVYDIAKFRKLSEAKAYAKAYVTSANKPVCIETKKL